MFGFILIFFAIGFGIILWSVYAAMTGIVPLWTRIFYGLACIASGCGAVYSTFSYSYYVNANTRFHGWPVPAIIFQRDGPDEPWLDFVGPTVILAYPMNVILFLIMPAIVVLITYLICRNHSSGNAEEASQTETPSNNSQSRVENSDNPYEPPSIAEDH